MALVTAGGDIGGASCMALGRAGSDVIVIDLRQDAGECMDVNGGQYID